MQDSVYDKFMQLLVHKVKSTPIGDGFDETVTSGPIVRWAAVIRSAIHCGLTQKFDRSQKLNSIRCGAISNTANWKVPNYWLEERDV